MGILSKSVLGAVFGAVLLASGASAQGTQAKFPDVPETHWASDAVTQLAQRSVFLGYPDGTFGGGRAVTRYEAAIGLLRLEQELIRRAVCDMLRPGKPGPQGRQGSAGAPGPRGEAGPMVTAGIAPEGWAELLSEQAKLWQSAEATRSAFTSLRDELRALRGRLGEIQLPLDPVEARTRKIEKKAPRAPLGF